MSSEESTAWLRARGVEIETVEDRAAAAAAARAAASEREEMLRSKSTREVAYVKISHDDDEPFDEREMVMGNEEYGDALARALAPAFAGGGTVDASKVRAEAMRTLGSAANAVSRAAIERETKDGKTETFALVHPSERNGWRGVYAYLDEVGMLKGLPLNRRAGALARECGFDGVSFYGDVYVGRVQTKPVPMRNVDFKLSDLDSSAAWMRAATMENVEYSAGLKELENAMGRNGGLQTINMSESGKARDGARFPGGQAEGYRWEQTEDEIELVVAVPRGATSKSVRVLFKPRHVVVKFNDEIVCDISNLYDAVRPDECTWTMGPDEVCVSLAKADDAVVWRALTVDPS